MTIAEMRRRSVRELAERRNPNPTEEDMALAKKTMNRYYRLCGMDERLLYLENDYKMHDKPYTIALAEKRDKLLDSLNSVFKNEFNARLVYFGYLPTICEVTSTRDLYLAHFYN